jgi:hypothetical protein
MGVSNSREINKQETHVHRQLAQDPRSAYLKKSGYSNAQLVSKYRQEYNDPNWKKGKEQNHYIVRKSMEDAERHTGYVPTKGHK